MPAIHRWTYGQESIPRQRLRLEVRKRISPAILRRSNLPETKECIHGERSSSLRLFVTRAINNASMNTAVSDVSILENKMPLNIQKRLFCLTCRTGTWKLPLKGSYINQGLYIKNARSCKCCK